MKTREVVGMSYDQLEDFFFTQLRQFKHIDLRTGDLIKQLVNELNTGTQQSDIRWKYSDGGPAVISEPISTLNIRNLVILPALREKEIALE